MTNAEILECINNGGYVKPDPIIQARPDVYLSDRDKPSQFTKDELKGAKMSGKGHIGLYRGKKIDKDKFMSAVMAYINDGVAMRRAYKLSGLSQPTFQKRINELFANGFLPWYLFTDGKPLNLQFDDDEINKTLREYRREHGGE